MISLIERLASKIKVVGECWEWIGALDDSGHGKISVEGRTLGAHRKVYELCFGPIFPGMVIRHKCDNARCVRPSHLMEGTQAQNMMDKTMRNRGGVAKLKTKEVLTIRQFLDKGSSTTSLAASYGVSTETIRLIKHRKTWRHI